MGWSKRQFVLRAFEEIGFAHYAYDLLPEQIESALYRLDAMCESWNAMGIRLGYPIPSSPQYGEPEEQTNVPDCANEAIYTNLSLRIAPMVGKVVTPDMRANAKLAYNAMLSNLVTVPEMQIGLMPRGAGQKQVVNTFILQQPEPILAGWGGAITFSGNEALDGEDLSDA